MKNWKKINKCVVCGTKLIFMPSKALDAKPEEGAMICERNHNRFSIFGGYHVGGPSAGQWHFNVRFPN